MHAGVARRGAMFTRVACEDVCKRRGCWPRRTDGTANQARMDATRPSEMFVSPSRHCPIFGWGARWWRNTCGKARCRVSRWVGGDARGARDGHAGGGMRQAHPQRGGTTAAAEAACGAWTAGRVGGLRKRVECEGGGKKGAENRKRKRKIGVALASQERHAHEGHKAVSYVKMHGLSLLVCSWLR